MVNEVVFSDVFLRLTCTPMPDWNCLGDFGRPLSKSEWLLQNKAPGHSQHKLSALCVFPEAFQEFVFALASAIFSLGLCPPPAALVGILHTAKPLGGARPLGLAEGVVKVCDAIWVRRVTSVMDVLPNGSVLSELNSAFLPGKGVQGAFVVDTVLSGAASCEFDVSGNSGFARVDLDLWQWFDSMAWPMIELSMGKFGVPDIILQFWSEFSERASCSVITSAGLSDRFHPVCGGLQGVGSSPLRSRFAGEAFVRIVDRFLSRYSCPPGVVLDQSLQALVSYGDDTTLFAHTSLLEPLFRLLSLLGPMTAIGIGMGKVHLCVWDPAFASQEFSLSVWNWRENSVSVCSVFADDAVTSCWVSLGVRRSGGRCDLTHQAFVRDKIIRWFYLLQGKCLHPDELRLSCQSLVGSLLQFAPVCFRLEVPVLFELERHLNRIIRASLHIPCTSPHGGFRAPLSSGGLGFMSIVGSRVSALLRELSVLLNDGTCASSFARWEWLRLRSAACDNWVSSSCIGHAVLVCAGFGFFFSQSRGVPPVQNSWWPG